MTRDEFEVIEWGNELCAEGRELFFLVFPEITFDGDGDLVDRIREMVMCRTDARPLVGIGSSTNYWEEDDKVCMEGGNYNVLVPFEDVFLSREDAEMAAVYSMHEFFKKGLALFEELRSRPVSAGAPFFDDMKSWVKV